TEARRAATSANGAAQIDPPAAIVTPRSAAADSASVSTGTRSAVPIVSADPRVSAIPVFQHDRLIVTQSD
ncbi:RND transporter, partial [Burkholderia sp. Tr-862]|nr:RND transporter [Burkholderia sp. Tr-862]